MAHLNLAIFAHSSLEKLSKSVRLRGHLLHTSASGHHTDFQLDSDLGSGQAVPKLKTCSGEAILLWIWMYVCVTVALKGEFHQLSSRYLKVLHQNWVIFGTFHNSLPLYLHRNSSYKRKKTKSKRKTTMLHGGVGARLVMCRVSFPPNKPLGTMKKRFNRGLIRP